MNNVVCLVSSLRAVFCEAGMLRAPKMGLLLIATERFRNIGEGTERGSYAERKEKEAALFKVDFALEIWLSWGEDVAHIRFLRDMPPCPVLFANCVRDSIGLKDNI